MDNTEYQQLVNRARTALAGDASEASIQLLDQNLERLCITLLLEWLIGDQRFESQSQQAEYWLARFYDEIFEDEQPDATRIYQRFSLSLPRATYVARLLRARRVAQWRHAAQVELRTELERARETAENYQKEGRAAFEECDVSLSPGAADELRVLYDRLATFKAESERPRPPRAKSSFGATRWFGMPAETLLLLLASLGTETGK
jgi:hypothetical protein